MVFPRQRPIIYRLLFAPRRSSTASRHVSDEETREHPQHRTPYKGSCSVSGLLARASNSYSGVGGRCSARTVSNRESLHKAILQLLHSVLIFAGAVNCTWRYKTHQGSSLAAVAELISDSNQFRRTFQIFPVPLPHAREIEAARHRMTVGFRIALHGMAVSRNQMKSLIESLRHANARAVPVR